MPRLALLLAFFAATNPLGARAPQGQRDAFGYRVEDTTTPFCGYQWVDPLGTPLVFSAPYAFPGDPPATDDGGALVSLGAPFAFYGVVYPTMVVSPNGFLAFASSLEGEDGRDFSNDPVGSVPSYQFSSGSPRFATPARLLAYHDDLEVGAGGVFVDFFPSCPRVSESLGVEPCSVVSWQGVRRVGFSESFSFQAVLYHQSGQIVMQYQSVDGSGGSSATVGIQDHHAQVGLGYHFNAANGLSPGLAVCFFSPRFPPGGPVADLALSVAHTEPLPESGPFDIAVHLGNFGPSPAENTVVTLTLPPGVSYLSDTCGGDWGDGQWQLGFLAEHAGSECTVSLNNNAGGTLALTTSSTAADPDSSNNVFMLELPAADDGDGVAKDVENSYPGGDGKPPFVKGDGNGDGIPDAQQPHVATLPLASGKGFVTVETAEGCGQLAAVATLLESSLATPDRDYDFPLGLTRFTVPCPQARVKLLFHVSGSIDRTYRSAGLPLGLPWLTLTEATVIRERGIFGVILPLRENAPGDSNAQGGVQHIGGPARRVPGSLR
ncbi:MAG: hypothetical protein ACK42L_05285 [Thermoanaerobaculum sp.]